MLDRHFSSTISLAPGRRRVAANQRAKRPGPQVARRIGFGPVSLSCPFSDPPANRVFVFFFFSRGLDAETTTKHSKAKEPDGWEPPSSEGTAIFVLREHIEMHAACFPGVLAQSLGLAWGLAWSMGWGFGGFVWCWWDPQRKEEMNQGEPQNGRGVALAYLRQASNFQHTTTWSCVAHEGGFPRPQCKSQNAEKAGLGSLTPSPRPSKVVSGGLRSRNNPGKTRYCARAQLL